MRVVCAEAINVGEQRLGSKSVNAGIDLAFFLLRLSKRLLLHDSFYAVTGAGANHATVTKGIGRRGGENCHSRFIGQVKIPQPGNRVWTNQRHVTGENKDVLG